MATTAIITSSPRGIKKVRPPLHVYRHLLREASYLPPVCRACIEPRIQLRFRRNRKDKAPEERLRQALHELRNLRAANLGNMGRMRRVMLLTFGRIGWRRHALLSSFRCPEQPENSVQLEARLRLLDDETPAARDWLDSWDKEKLLALARSQASQDLRASPRPSAVQKKLDPAKAVPPISIWGKPPSAGLARTKERKWWKQLENRVLPPLPRSEWDLLKQLATGQADSRWNVPPRRTLAAALPRASAPAADRSSIDLWDWEKYLAGPIRVIERPNSRRFRLPPGPGTSQPETPFDGLIIGIHRYTPRFWRRLYKEIWQLSPVMEKKAGGLANSWSIMWGGTSLQPAPPTVASLEFFEGVDARGKVLVQPPGGAQ